MDTASACVVVPVYNEAAVLSDVLIQLREHFAHVICVDDGSSDSSAEIARAAGATVLEHAINLGQGAALQTGFDYVLSATKYDWVVTFDADGQHDPRNAVAMLNVAREGGHDVVLGSRKGGKVVDQPMSRQLLLRLGVLFTRLSTGLSVTDTHNGLRVLSRRALNGIRLRQPGMAYASELESAVARLELKWTEVPVDITYTAYSRAKGQQNMNAINVVYDLVLARLRAS